MCRSKDGLPHNPVSEPGGAARISRCAMTRQTGGKQAGGRSVEKSPINATSVTLHPLNMVKKEFVEQQYVLSSFPVTNLGESILDQRQGPGALSNSPWINLPGQNTLAIHQAVVYLDLTAL